MQHLFVTGGCGFIGSTIARAFREQGWAVTCFDNLRRRGSELIMGQLQKNGVRFIHGDVRLAEDFDSIAHSFDLAIDCSAEPSVLAGQQGSEARALIGINLGGTIQLAEFCRARTIPLIFLSTSRVYPVAALNDLPFEETATRFQVKPGLPHILEEGLATTFPLSGTRSLYGATKLASELLLQEYAANYNLPILINRCGVVAGPWQLGKIDQGFLTFWVASHVYGRPLTYLGFGGSGKQVRDILHASDLADLLLIQAGKIGNFRGEVFHASGGIPFSLSLLEASELCRAATGHQIPINGNTTQRPQDVRWLALDSQTTRQRFQWTPRRSPADTLHEIHRWIIDGGDALKSVLG